MDDSYLNLFKKSKKLLADVSLKDHVPKNDGAVYVFLVKDYNVVLTITKLDSSKSSIWKREFTCDCRASIRGSQELCSHSLAALTWLVFN